MSKRQRKILFAKPSRVERATARKMAELRDMLIRTIRAQDRADRGAVKRRQANG